MSIKFTLDFINTFSIYIVYNLHAYGIQMSNTKVIANLRIEKSLKDQAISVANQLWLSLSSVMSLLLRKFVIEKKIEIWLDENWFTAQKKEVLKAAIQDARENWETINSIDDIL